MQAGGEVPHATSVPDGQPHWPAVQLAPVGQAWPQPPQFCASLVRATQVPEHSVWDAAQAPHCPFVQASPGPHLVPQKPQFCGSLFTSVQVVPQS